MTNLVATLIFVAVTNWTTVSRTVPVCDQVGCLVIHYNTLHQVGSIGTNLVARIEWKEKRFDMLLEQGQFQTVPTLTRDEIESPFIYVTNGVSIFR